MCPYKRACLGANRRDSLGSCLSMWCRTAAPLPPCCSRELSRGRRGQKADARPSEQATRSLDGLRVLLQGGRMVARPEEVFEIQRSLPHGHVAAVMGMMRKLDLPRLLSRTVSRERDLDLALIASRIIAPGSNWRPLGRSRRRRRVPAWGGCSISASSRNGRFMPRSTGWANNKTAWNDPWRAVT